ncbi:MAG: hypothetical protein PHG85_02340 [Candidatus Altiarchaeota archaeon]|nr:hypothetical protein [Candidatus Altiarchaeota archaeon]
MNKKTAISAAIITIALILSQDALAIGISPGSATFDNMMRGGYGEQTLGLSNAGDNDLVIIANLDGQAKSWITIEPALVNATLPKRGTLLFKIKVMLPPSVSTGTYNATLQLSTLNLEDFTSGSSGAKVMPGLSVPIKIIVSGQELIDYEIQGFTVGDTEKDEPIKYAIIVNNKGNVQVTPNITIEVLNADKSRTFFTEEVPKTAILPSTKQTIEGSIDSEGMKIGRYWLRATAYLRDRTLPKKEIDFNIVAVGAISLSGEFTELIIPKTASPGDKVRVTAYLQNTCDKVLDAQSSCEVLSGGKIVDNLESKELRVEPGAVGELASYFTVPSGGGEYQFKCLINYQSKQTETREATLTASGVSSQGGASNILLYGVIGLVVIVILYLLYSRTRRR